VKAFYFANGGGNSIASGTAVSAGKYTARVGEEAFAGWSAGSSRETQVGIRLAAGGKWIRTRGPTSNGIAVEARRATVGGYT
jgi:hypothetical protein